MNNYAEEWDADETVRLGRSRMGCTRESGAPLTIPPWEAIHPDSIPPYYEEETFQAFRAPWYRYVRMCQALGSNVNQLGVTAWELFRADGFGPLCAFRGAKEDFPDREAPDAVWHALRQQLEGADLPVLVPNQGQGLIELWSEASLYTTCQQANRDIAHRLTTAANPEGASADANLAAALGSTKLANAFTGEAIRLAEIAHRHAGDPLEEGHSTAGEETPEELREDNQRRAQAARERSRARKQRRQRKTGSSAAGSRRQQSARGQTGSSASGDLWANYRPPQQQQQQQRTVELAPATEGSALGDEEEAWRTLTPPRQPEQKARPSTRLDSRRSVSIQRERRPTEGPGAKQPTRRPTESSGARQPSRRPQERADMGPRIRAGRE